MKTLKIDEKWSVEYDPANNDRPVRVLRYGEDTSHDISPHWDWTNDVHAMFYALLEDRTRIAELERECKLLNICASRKLSGVGVIAAIDNLERFADKPWDEVRLIVQQHINAYADEIYRRLRQVRDHGDQEEASISDGEAGQGSGEGGD